MKTLEERIKYRNKYVDIDFRQHPEKYQIGRGEEGVLLAEPYKSELLPHWRFKTPEIAEASAKTIYTMFLNYLVENDFVGADMARKYLQMGYTRARRYANHASGKKYKGPVPLHLRGISGAHGRPELSKQVDEEKAEAASKFFTYYKQAKENFQYQALKKKHKERYA